MVTAFYGLLALLLVVTGGLCAYEARSYTGEQRARAPLLWRAYLACGPLLLAVGSGAVAALLLGSNVWLVAGVLALAGSLPLLVQHLLHRKLGIERSPLGDRIAERVSRTLGVPDAN